MSIHHGSRLDQELDALLERLGVQQERHDALSQQEDLHITCLCSDVDRLLWKGVQKHLIPVKHPTGGALHWHTHEVETTSRPLPWQLRRIQENLGQAHLILLFVSIDLLAALSDRAEEVYQVLIAALRREQPARGLVIPARPAAWYDDYLTDLPRVPRKRTLTTMRHTELGYVEIANAVQQIINDLLHSPSQDDGL